MSEIVDFRKIEVLIKEGRLDEARGVLDTLIAVLESGGTEPDSVLLAEAYFRRGKIAWRQGRRADAQNDYSRALSLDASSPAALALEQARDVDAFFNHDLYNP